MRLFMPRTLALIVVCTLGLFACAAQADGEDGDIGETGADLTSGGAGCDRSTILASATGDRRTILQRGFSWFDQKVPYSQSKSHEGYRTDCSGFVSMCWQLPESFTTADFIGGDGQNTVLPSYDALLPGDGFVRRSGGEGHAILFAGWQDSKHSGACVIEQESTALGMQFHVRTTSSLKASGFHAMRADKLAGSGTGAGTVTAPDPPKTPPAGGTISTTSGSTGTSGASGTSGTSGGMRCVNDGMCNPGNDGSGLICVAGRCAPGCHSDAQCPGTSTCSGGQCR